MKSAIDIKSLDWWLCISILLTMAAALTGFKEGFYATIVISIIRIGASLFSQGIKSDPTINRFTYSFLIIVSFIVWDKIPIAWWLTFIATAIYTFIDKYIVERLLVFLE